MRFRTYDRIEQQILESGKASIRLRIKWGAMVLHDPRYTHAHGVIKKGAVDELIARATARGVKLSRREIMYRLQAARTYTTEAEIVHACALFQTWSELRSAGFPAVEVSEEAGLFDVPGDAAPSREEPYDPRAPHEQRDAAVRQLNRILDSPEANGQEVLPGLPGLRIFLPGFSPDTVGRETSFRKAFEIHYDIRKHATAQLRAAADQSQREDVEREEKLNRMFDAVARNLDATLGDGDDALLGAEATAR